MDRNGERGAALVEGAVVIALLLIPLLLGTIDIGRAIYVTIAVEEAAQEGAVFGAFEGQDLSGTNDVIERVQSSQCDVGESPPCGFPDLSTDTTITVTCTDVARTDADGSSISVTVDHQLNLFTPFLPSLNIVRTADADGFTPCWP